MLKKMILLLLVALMNCQQSSRDQHEECRRGKKSASEDLESDKLGLYFFGIPDPKFNLIIKILNEEYHIAIKGGGDVVTEEGKCYNEFMENEIRKKYGQDIFELVRQRAELLYAKGLADKDAYFPGGRAAIDRFLACNLTFFDILPANKEKPVVYVDVFIDTLGLIKDTKIRKGFERKFDSEAMRVLKLMDRWMPARANGKAVESKVTLQVKFDPKLKQGVDCK